MHRNFTPTKKVDLLLTLKHLNSSHAKGILALDLGLKKVGVAYAELGIDIPLPVEVIVFNQDKLVFSKKLQEIIEPRDISVIVIGVASEQSKKKYKALISVINSLAKAQKVPIKVTFEDESYTTATANEMLKEYGIKRKKRNKIDDMIAAQLILESFLTKLKRVALS